VKLRFTPEATVNLAEIGDYISERSPGAAQRVQSAILDSIDLLRDNPELGRMQRSRGVRKLVTRKYPYLVYYRISERADAVDILSIVHPARARQHQDD
jgi:toxin ParE1/3/4